MSRPNLSVRPAAWALLFFTASVMGGCGACLQRSGQASLGIMPGVVNDPGNRSLRRGIMRWGLDEFCKELTNRGAPLRLRDEDPVAGRFYARTCTHQELQDGDVFVQFGGVGYVWTNVSLRLAFEASGAIQYNQDFLMDGSTMYAYFRTKTIASKTFQTTMVERGAAAGTAAIGGFANPIAEQVIDQQLRRGFTVIRDEDGTVDWGLGTVEKGNRPTKPFEVRGDDRLTMMNERTEVHGEQLDFLGPFHVDDDDRALFLNIAIDGVPAVDVMVVAKNTGDQWLDQFVRAPGVPQPPLPPLMSDVVSIRTQWQKVLPVAKGYYYVVIDNSSVVGGVAPPNTGSVPLLPTALASPPPAALVNVVVQVGDAP